MFTGLVEEVGKLVSIHHGAASAKLTIEAPLVAEGTRIGDSVAINGTCLTVVALQGSRLSFEAVPETLSRSSLKRVRAGDGLNLERALAVGQRLGGHFVQGHVDGTGTLLAVTENDNAHILRIGAAPELMRYIIPKGSVALDGISLTMADVAADSFTVWIIPHTYANTTLRDRRIGDALNIENDMLAKYIERLLQARSGGSGGVTMETLASSGFLTE
jgi:riboflavin synthase